MTMPNITPTPDAQTRIEAVLRERKVRFLGDVHPDELIPPLAAAIIEALGLTEERRVMTPQGTSRPVHDGEQLGDYLRSLGWWIESRLFTEWERTEPTE